MEQRLDGSLAVRFRQSYVSVMECRPRPKTPPAPKLVRSRKHLSKTDRAWMKDFNLQKSPH